jgi:hypothetical protein
VLWHLRVVLPERVHIAPAHVPAGHNPKRRHSFFISYSFIFTSTVHLCLLFTMSFEVYAQLRQFTAVLARPLRVAGRGLATDGCTGALTPKSRLLYRSSHFLKTRSFITPSNISTMPLRIPEYRLIFRQPLSCFVRDVMFASEFVHGFTSFLRIHIYSHYHNELQNGRLRVCTFEA